MPKRKRNDEKNEADTGPKKPTAWTPAEEALFLAAINDIVSKQLWAGVKDGPLAARQNGGVTSHWKSMYRKLVKEYVKEQ